MSDNILSDFVAFIEKSAQLMGGVQAPVPAPALKVNAAPAAVAGIPQPVAQGGTEQSMGGANVQPTAVPSAQGLARQSDTDKVNNSTTTDVTNPSHGGSEGVPKAITTPGQPLKKSKF